VSAASRDDALEATRARIEKLKMESGSGSAAGQKKSFTSESGAASNKKKLTDVKVNPKIAASLGLKPVVAAPKTTTSAAAGAAVTNSNEVDLLGGLIDDEIAAPPAVSNDTNGGWDAFGESSAASAAVDPFAAPVAAAPAPTSASSSPKPPLVPARTALPEDAFSDLTGLNKPLQPMAVVRKSPGASPVAGAAAGSSPGGAGGSGSDPFGGFADFSAAPTTSNTTSAQAASNDPFADLLS
jgi:hypothetical protein